MSYRDNNFSDKQMRGIQMAFNGTKKKYPFLKKWSLSQNFEKYDSFLYLDVFVNMYEIADYLDLKVRDYYRQNEKDMFASALSVFLKKKDSDNEWANDEDVFNLGYNLRVEMDSYLNNLYDLLPDNNKIFYTFDTIFGPQEYLVTIKLDNYIHINN